MNTKGKRLTKILEDELGPIGFAGFLRGARASMELSQVAMAQRLGIAPSTLCDIERGRHIVSIALAAEIAKSCGLSKEMAVLAAIQDQLDRSGIDMRIAVGA